MIVRLRLLVRDSHGAGAAEFALVLPLFLLLLFGVIDGGRFLWEVNRAEKATQVGVRMAIVTAVVASDLPAVDYTTEASLSPGDTIPAAALGEVKCTNSACTCEVSPCPGLTRDSTAFDKIVERMQDIAPDITAANVEVLYRGSGLGFAGDPNGMDVSPLVTVQLKDLEFRPITTLLFVGINLPSSAATLTAEDSIGSHSN